MFRPPRLAALLAGLATSIASIVAIPSPAAAVDPPRFDGTAQEHAAASCWEIKQQDPGATDGIYWLHTPTLGAPGQFWCDMTTDGGGWALVGRGRDNWDFKTHGQQEQYAEYILRTNPDGTDAFDPAALPGETIDGLLDGGAVSDLTDGVRIRRARNTAGTQWQEVRLELESVSTWTWGFGGGLRTTDTILDGSSYGPGQTRDSASSDAGFDPGNLAGFNDHRRLITGEYSSLGWRMGFAYGGTVCGSSASTSFLYSTASSNCYAKPFAQVFVRPRLTQADLAFTPLGLNALPAESERPLVDQKPQTLLGGVSGYTSTDNWDRHEVPVWAITEIGDTVYIGGSFTTVQDLENDTTADQPFLAAFERDTGRWIPTFSPDVNGIVYDLEVTPDGRLVVVGEFLDIDGVADTAGLAVVDPVSGAPDPAWASSVADNDPWVNAVDTDGQHLYLAGDFAYLQRDGQSDFRVWRVARVDARTGVVDWTWRPATNFKVVDIDVDGDRAHLAGWFSAVGGVADAGRRASVDLIDGTPLPGQLPYEPSDTRSSRWYQQAIDADGDRVFSVGSQHNFHLLDRDTLELLKSHVTRAGGDFQAIAVSDGIVYASCHCGAWNYVDSNSLEELGIDSTSAQKVNYVLAFDAVTGEHLPWVPELQFSNRREGPWEAFVDSRDCVWFGGDITLGRWNGSGYDEAPGFTRHCPVDTTPPATPANFTASPVDGDVLLDWDGVSDPSGVLYEVWRDDRAHAVVTGSDYTDTDVTETHTYAVRAVDRSHLGTGSGNKTASTTPRTVSIVAPVEYVGAASAWDYFDGDSDPGSGWYLPGFDTSSWPSGTGSLGFGDGDETTTVDGAALVLQTVTTFDTTAADLAVSDVTTISVVADDGAAVYLNGTLVDTWNISGEFPYDHTMFATAPVFGAAERTPRPISVPTALLTEGTNTLAVAVHQSWRNNPDGHLAVTVTSDNGAPLDTVAPTSGAVAANATSPNSIEVSWASAADNGTVDGYLVERTGGWSRYVRDTTPITDADLLAGTAYTYEVTPYDTAGNAGTTALGTATTPDPVVADEVLAADAVWRYHYDTGGLADGWQAPAFDDSAWASGPALLGFGDADIATDISSGPAPRPLTAYLRTTFESPDPSALDALLLEVLRDDGVVIHVNGVEIARDNLPDGPIGPETFASTEITVADERTPLLVSVDPSFLVAGTNTIAVEVHANYRATPDLAIGVRAETAPA